MIRAIADGEVVTEPGKLCPVPGCGRQRNGRRLCDRHAYRLRRYGSVDAGRVRVGLADDIISEAIRSDTDACIIWPLSTSHWGYACLKRGGTSIRVSRVILEATIGPPPTPEHQAAHSPVVCHNPRCINPRHLRWATRSENQSDTLLDGTKPRGEKHGNSRLSDDQAREVLRSTEKTHAMAKRFGVHPETIRKIRNRSSWAWL
jgi:hypothetical protein